MKSYKFLFLLCTLLFISCSQTKNTEAENTNSSDTQTNLSSINITNSILNSRESDCQNYDNSYRSGVKDLKRNLAFEGSIKITSTDTSCTLSSNNIPNHDFNDETANFRSDVIRKPKNFQIIRNPSFASSPTPLNHAFWDAVLLNGVVVDLKSAGCYLPSDARADQDGNTEAGCPPNSQWNLIPLEYSTKFGVDLHNAHVQPDGSYHYHGNPNALFDDQPNGDGSPLIGYAADGFPIYGSYILDESSGLYRKVISGYTLKIGSRGPKTNQNPGGNFTGIYEEDWEWTDTGDLDECNGMTYKGTYAYYVTDTYPYILNCFKGRVHDSFSK